MPQGFQATGSARKQPAQLAGLEMLVNYPIGRMDIQYREVRSGGLTSAGVSTLQLIVTDAEARALSKAFAELADKIAKEGGAKQ